MKVLSKGLWRHSFACEECSAVLMTEETDYKTQQIGREVKIYCVCPECETEYFIDSKSMSEEVRLKILNRESQAQPRPPFNPLAK